MNIEKIDKENGRATITLNTEELRVLGNALFGASKNEKYLEQRTFDELYAYLLILRTLTQYGTIPAFEFNRAFELLHKYEEENKALNF